MPVIESTVIVVADAATLAARAVLVTPPVSAIRSVPAVYVCLFSVKNKVTLSTAQILIPLPTQAFTIILRVREWSVSWSAVGAPPSGNTPTRISASSIISSLDTEKSVLPDVLILRLPRNFQKLHKQPHQPQDK